MTEATRGNHLQDLRYLLFGACSDYLGVFSIHNDLQKRFELSRHVVQLLSR